VLESRPNIEDAIRNRQVLIVFNTMGGQKAVSDSKSLRRSRHRHALDLDIKLHRP
jgi:carbamoyl-phosphate synthase large subunit